MVVVGNVMCLAEFLFKYSHLMIINIMTFWRSALKIFKKNLYMQKCEDVPVSLSSWAVSDSVLRDEEQRFPGDVCCLQSGAHCGWLQQELTLGPRKSAHMKICRDDVISLINSEWDSNSFEAFKITVLYVGSLISQGR